MDLLKIWHQICGNCRFSNTSLQIGNQHNWNALMHLLVITIRLDDWASKPNVLVISPGEGNSDASHFGAHSISVLFDGSEIFGLSSNLGFQLFDLLFR